MNRKVRIALAVLAAVLLAAGLAWHLSTSREPLYQGMTSAAWVAKLERPVDNDAFQQWQSLGPDAAPILARALRKGDRWSDLTYSKIRARLPALLQKPWPQPRDSSRARLNAAIVLARLGPKAASAAPALARALSDKNPSVRLAAALALSNVLPAAEKDKPKLLPDLLRAANDPEVFVREHALTFLGDYQNDSRLVAPVFAKAVLDPQMPVRMRAIVGLNRMNFGDVDASEIAPLLIDCLESPETVLRAIAATKLGVMKKKPALAVPALIKLLDDPEVVVRQAAAVALGKFGADARIAVPALVKNLTASEPTDRTAATNALLLIDPARLPQSSVAK